MRVKLRVEMLVVFMVMFVVVVVAMVMAVVMIVCGFVNAFWRIAASPPLRATLHASYQRLLQHHSRACVGDLRATAAMAWQAVRMRMQE